VAATLPAHPETEAEPAGGPVQTFTVTQVFAGNPFVRYNLIPRNWWLMTPIMALLMLVAVLVQRSVPPTQTIQLALIAELIPAMTLRFVRLERSGERGGIERFAIMLLCIALPMLVFGCSLSVWVAIKPSASWSQMLGIAVIAGIAASILLSGRLASLLAAQVGLWSGIALSDGSIASVWLLTLGFASSVALAVHYSRQQKIAAANHRQREHARFRAEEFLAEYENSGEGWFWETDAAGAIAYVSPIVGATLGQASEAILGRPFTEYFVTDGAGPVSQCTLSFHLASRCSFQELAVRGVCVGDDKLWAISGRPIYDQHANFLGFRGSGADLNERRRSLRDTSRLAHYDSLTGLANRFQMSQSLDKILNAEHEGDRACAVLLLDLDRFKQVNDTLGHMAGDALLKIVAQRLAAAVGDRGRVGRLGGDEFQVIVPGRVPRSDLAALAQEIIEALSQPYAIDDAPVAIGASVGIALALDDGVTSEALVRNADRALYAAKDAGRGCHHFYAASLHSDAEERRQLEHDLRQAVANGGLELFYQPVVQTSTEQITGFEALLRWNHPIWGAMSPAHFIPIAEDAGLIAPIGEWVLRTACRDLGRWPETVRVAVNVSALQFTNPALPGIVTSALAAAGVTPSRLELEITERVFLSEVEGVNGAFAALKRLGVRLTLDDFGTGYSSLGYLKEAPFDVIKIDQSFVRGATQPDSRAGAIIASIVRLAEALGMATTAEGVETAGELDLIRKLGCSHVQGYIYERPLCFADATMRLNTGLGGVAHPGEANVEDWSARQRVTLAYGGTERPATIRSLSTTGALIEGVRDIPEYAAFTLVLADGNAVAATARWVQEDLLGVEFALPLLGIADWSDPHPPLVQSA
jgi:diguanylate cyclase (GGDEF)-like protein